MTTFAPSPTATPAVPVATALPVTTTAPRSTSDRAMSVPTIVAAFGAPVLAAIGFTGSYNGLRQLATDHHFGSFAPWFPIGIDAGILVLLALDLHLIRKRTPWPVIRLLAHLLTLATIVFNAASAPGPVRDDLIGAAMHGILPVLFIAAVEAARRLVIKAANLAAGHHTDGVPLNRWILAPGSAFAMYRRMRLRGIASYDTAVSMEKNLLVYREMLDRDTKGGWRKASSEARLPMTMARYGLSVNEALDLPATAREDERIRAERALVEEQEAQTRAERRAADAEVERLRAVGTVETTRHEVAAQTGVAAAVADSRVQAAARDAVALESAESAEADARRATAEKRAAEERARTLEADRAAAATDHAVAAERQATAEIDQRAAALEQSAAASRLATAEANAAALATRARAAATENAVLEAEALLKLSPTERNARMVARMILATGSRDPESVPLAEIAAVLGGSESTASARRKEAVALIADGYTG